MKKLIVILSLLISSVPAITCGDELLILGEYDGPPKYYLENGKPRGFIVDITARCMKEIGHPYKIELYPWKRAYKMALEGKGGIIGLSMNSERLKVFNYSEPLYYGDLMVVVRKGKEFAFNAIPDLKGKVIGVGRGSSYGDAFEKAVSDGIFKLYEFSNPANALKMVLVGRIDAILIGPGKHGVRKVISRDKKLKMEDFSVLSRPFKRDAKYLGIPKSLGMKKFLNKFNTALKNAQEAGVTDEIIRRYYSD